MISASSLTRLVALAVALTTWSSVEAAERSFSIDYERHVFLKDGEPFRYISGEIHYNRIHPAYWRDRLQRLRAAGLNAVQVYVPWNLHEPQEGHFEFGGIANVTGFIQEAQQQGLLVLLRAGPYICAEWENGGLPYWLLKKPGIQLRVSNDAYVKAFTAFYNKFLPMVKPLLYQNGGPILMTQIENEYGSDGCDKKYMETLRDLFHSHLGTDHLLYTTDGSHLAFVECGTVDGVFSTVDFGPASEEQIKINFDLQQLHAKGGPKVNSEFYPGWFTTWSATQSNYPTLKANLEALKTIWAMNASVSIYMFHGGTNFGFWNGAEVYGPLITSYDYGAPVAENGDIGPLFRAISSWIGNLTDYDTKPQHPPLNLPAANYGTVKLTATEANLMDGLAPASTSCVTSDSPQSFEELNQMLGFVLYSTTLQYGGKKLDLAKGKDHLYVYLNKQYQGMLLFDFNLVTNLTLEVNAKPGDLLQVLVENRGRQTYPSFIDPKGLFPDVLLDEVVVSNWTSCRVNMSESSPLFIQPGLHMAMSPSSGPTGPRVWRSIFSVHDLRPRDTWLDPTGFTKGVAFVNGFNLGRYWPTVGPQVTLYVPAPVLASGENELVLVELVGNAAEPAVSFVNKPVYRWT